MMQGVMMDQHVAALTEQFGAEALGRLREDYERCTRSGLPISIALVDLDYFHDLNAREGPDLGDDVLSAVAERLESALESDAWLAHQGGDQFFVAMPGLEAEESFLAAERLRAAVAAEPLKLDKKRSVAVTVSVGLASAPKHANAPEALLRRAIGAMYRAKSLGRNRVGLPTEERMVTKTSHYPPSHLERLKALARRLGVGEAELLREALDDLLLKYKKQRPTVD